MKQDKDKLKLSTPTINIKLIYNNNNNNVVIGTCLEVFYQVRGVVPCPNYIWKLVVVD